MDKKKSLMRSLRIFKKNLGKNMTVDKMILFGSQATGKTHKWSDVDLILVSKKFRKMNFFERGAKLYNYWSVRRPVDFLCYTPEEFARKSKGITIVREALKHGIEV